EDAQIGQVIAAVMGGAIRAHQTSPVETEDDGKILKRDLLEDLIIRSLEERAVDIDHRSGPRLGHAGGERHRMALADTHIEELLGELVANRLKLVPFTHGGCEDSDLRVTATGLEKSRADGVGIRAA